MIAARPPWDFPRAISGIGILVQVGLDHGIREASSLAGTGLSGADLLQPDRQVEAAQELQVIRNLQRCAGHELPLGLEAGMRYRATTFGVWGLAVLSSSTVQQAVSVGLRYARLTSAFCLPRFETRGNEDLMVADISTLPADVSRFLLERDAAALISLQRSVFPVRIPFTRVDCSFPEPVYAGAIRELLGTPVRFNQPMNCIGISSEWRQSRFPQGDLSTFAFCEAECRKLLESRQLQDGVAGRIRRELMMNMQSQPSMEVLADRLSMTVRTLRRRLKEEGAAYEGLLLEARQALAEEFLKTTDLSVEEIAERLGYLQATNFVRAFKRWHGVTPRQFRGAKD